MKYVLLALLIATPMRGWTTILNGRESGGGYADSLPLPTLLKIKTDLTKQVRVLPAQTLLNRKIPADWTSDRIANVIENLKINSSAQSLNIEGDGRLKILDFDPTNNSISVLAAFFLYYGRDLTERKLDLEVEGEIKQKLLHEVSHLWGFSEPEALEYSKNLLLDIEQDTLNCNADFIGYEGNVNRTYFSYGFGTGQIYQYRRHIKMGDDDEGVPSVGRYFNPTWISSQPGDIKITDQEIILTGVGKFLLKVSRNVNEYGISTGTLEVKNGDDFTTQTVECWTVNPR